MNAACCYPPAGGQGMTPEEDPSLLSPRMTVTPGAGSISMTSVLPARSDSGMLGEPEPRAGLVSAPECPTLTGSVTAAQPGQIPRGSPTDCGHSQGQIPGSPSGRSGGDLRAEPRADPGQIPEQIPSPSRRQRAARRASRQAAARTAPSGRRAGRRHYAGQPWPARRPI